MLIHNEAHCAVEPSGECPSRPRDGNTDRINYHNTALSHTYPTDTQANLYSSEYDCQNSESSQANIHRLIVCTHFGHFLNRWGQNTNKKGIGKVSGQARRHN